MKSWKWMAVLMLGVALAVGSGCGGDDDDDDKASGGKGAAGKGSEGKAGTGAPAEMMDVPEGGVACGNQVCKPQEGSTVTLCCADPFSATCGMMQGQSCVRRTETDPRCPSVMAGGMFMLASCCTDSGDCGIDTSVFTGEPCTELGEAAQGAMMMGAGQFITFPPPQKCDE